MQKHNFQFFPSFYFLALISLLPIWMCQYLPMHDLPQHVAQISHLSNYNFFSNHNLFYLDLTTPYILGILASSLLAKILGLQIAVKVILSVTVLTTTLALAKLLQQIKGDPYWSLLGFALAFGFNFSAGHYNFLVATPLGIYFISLFISQDFIETTQQKYLFLGTLVTLYFAHFLVFLFCVFLLTVRLIIQLNKTQLKFIVSLLAPLSLVCCSLIYKWGLNIPTINIHFSSIQLHLSNFFPLSFGPIFTGKWLLGIAIMIFLWLSEIKFNEAPKIIIGASAILFYFLLPHYYFVHTLYHRFAGLVFSIMLTMVKPTERSQRKKKLSHVVLVSGIAIWLININFHLFAFDKEAKDFNVIMQAMQPNKQLLSLVFNEKSSAVEGYPYGHFGSWYEAYKGGQLGFSYSMQPPQFIRLKKEFHPRHWAYARRIRKNPQHLNWNKVKHFDYILIRSHRERASLFGKNRHHLRLLASSPGWWLYENASKTS